MIREVYDISGASELYFTLTSKLTQPLYITQSAPRAVSINWGDGSEEETSENLSAQFSHTYAEAGDYVVKIYVAEEETWTTGLKSGSDNYGLIGKYTTKSDTYPTLTGAIFKDGAILGDYAFTQCTGLASFTIPTGTTSVPQYAFNKCTGIRGITIPSSITAFGDNAFIDSGLTFINITDLSAWCAIAFTSSNNPLNIAKNLYLNGTLVTALEIPDSITNISKFAFQGCTSITSVMIGNGLTDLNTGTFLCCTNLTSVVLGDSLTYIGPNAFDGCTNLTSITIPNSVKNVGAIAFRDCVNLTNIVIPDGVPAIGNNTFEGCTSLMNVTLPSSVTSISAEAFKNCTSLTTIIIPDRVTYISSSIFNGCTSLMNVTISSKATVIENSAFYGCISLMSVIIPDKVTNIKPGAFSGCVTLTSITSENITPPKVSSNTFTDVPTDCLIYVPFDSVDTYKAADNWSTRADYIQAIPES